MQVLPLGLQLPPGWGPLGWLAVLCATVRREPGTDAVLTAAAAALAAAAAAGGGGGDVRGAAAGPGAGGGGGGGYYGGAGGLYGGPDTDTLLGRRGDDGEWLSSDTSILLTRDACVRYAESRCTCERLSMHGTAQIRRRWQHLPWPLTHPRVSSLMLIIQQLLSPSLPLPPPSPSTVSLRDWFNVNSLSLYLPPGQARTAAAAPAARAARWRRTGGTWCRRPSCRRPPRR